MDNPENEGELLPPPEHPKINPRTGLPRAHRVRDLSAKYGKPAWEYSDGSVRDENGLSLELIPGGEQHLVTSDNAGRMRLDGIARERAEKYERARAGANRALTAIRRRKWNAEKKSWDDDGAEWEDPKDLDFVEAINEAQTAQALMVGDSSSTRAAEYVMKHTGLSEERLTPQAPAGDNKSLTQGILALLARALSGSGELDVIDGEYSDVSQGETRLGNGE